MINPENQPKKIFTIGVVADYFRCHQRTVLRWITEGKLDAYQPNQEYGISGEQILKKLFNVTNQPQYRVRFHYDSVGKRAVDTTITRNLNRAMAYAIRTAF